ncbi:MAG: MogA/MoaB family molybdenum cofactor biosynthesis protein [Promethearchaeota archaeon]
MTDLPDTIAEHKKKALANIKFALFVFSTTRYNEIRDNKVSTDKTVKLVADLISGGNHSLSRHIFYPDDFDTARSAIDSWFKSGDEDVLITSGGTGISPRDVTIEAVKSLNLSCLPGFGEIFRFLSYQEIGSAAILSRSEAFYSDGKCVFCLPGSPKAVKLALMQIILPEIGHVLSQLRKVE